MNKLAETLAETLAAIKQNTIQLLTLSAAQRTTVLQRFAALILEKQDDLLSANTQDLQNAQGKISASLHSRLQLTKSKLEEITSGILHIAKLEDLLGKTQKKTLLDDDLELEKISTPIGVIAIIFEARPDVIPQVLSLLLKTGNAALLKGGKEAQHTNLAFMEIVHQINEEFSFLPPNWATLISGRDEVHELLKFPQYIDLIIPRGSNQLVQFIMENTQIPVLGHADGVCHIYLDEALDTNKALEIVIDSKTQYPSACNALETILFNENLDVQFEKQLLEKLKNNQIKINFPTSSENFHQEFSALELNIVKVKNLDAAIKHINEFGSHHTDCIISKRDDNISRFLQEVDSANVFVNCSTRFADGFRFGLGAEVGISTNKIHARGPVGLEGLLSYKYLLRGSGQIVASYTGKNRRPFIHKDMA